MTPGIYSAVSGLNARWTQQERIAENISSANAIGSKREVPAFGTFQRALQQAGAEQGAALNYAQPANIDWTQGPLQKTEQPLDAAISGPGFFSVQTPAGPRLTRNGHFHVNESSQLVNDAGAQVLGRNGPIRLPKGNPAITANGTVTVNGKAVDTLQIFDPPTTALKSEGGGSLFSMGDLKIDPVKEPQLAIGALETSNVELPKEMVGMIQNQRMFDMLTRAFQTQDEGLAKAIQDLSMS